MYNSTHNKSLLRKVFCLWSKCFLFYYAKNAQGNGSSHLLSFFFPIKESCHPKRVSLTMEDITQGMTNKENNNYNKTLMKEDVINGFFLIFTKKSSIFQRPFSPLKLTQSQYFSLACLRSKKIKKKK